MRKTFRLVASTAIGAVLLLSLGVGATLAKPGDKPAPQKPAVQVIDLAEAWCFDDAGDLYCNVQSGTLTIKEWPNGASDSKVDMVIRTDVTREGAFVARTIQTKKSHSTFSADGSYSTDERERTTWTDGAQKCVTESHFKSVDFEVKVDTSRTTCH